MAEKDVVVQNMERLARTLLVGSNQLLHLNGSVDVLVRRFLDLLMSCVRTMPTKVSAFEPVRGKLLEYWDGYQRTAFNSKSEVLGQLGVVLRVVRSLVMSALKTVGAEKGKCEEISVLFDETKVLLESK